MCTFMHVPKEAVNDFFLIKRRSSSTHTQKRSQLKKAMVNKREKMCYH